MLLSCQLGSRECSENEFKVLYGVFFGMEVVSGGGGVNWEVYSDGCFYFLIF